MSSTSLGKRLRETSHPVALGRLLPGGTHLKLRGDQLIIENLHGRATMPLPCAVGCRRLLFLSQDPAVHEFLPLPNVTTRFGSVYLDCTHACDVVLHAAAHFSAAEATGGLTVRHLPPSAERRSLPYVSNLGFPFNVMYSSGQTVEITADHPTTVAPARVIRDPLFSARPGRVPSGGRRRTMLVARYGTPSDAPLVAPEWRRNGPAERAKPGELERYLFDHIEPDAWYPAPELLRLLDDARTAPREVVMPAERVWLGVLEEWFPSPRWTKSLRQAVSAALKSEPRGVHDFHVLALALKGHPDAGYCGPENPTELECRRLLLRRLST